MADNGRWFKLWCSSVNDPDLANLDVADFGRWAKFGAYLKEHGTDGSVTLKPPSKNIVSMLQLRDFNDIKTCFERMPNVTVSTETLDIVSLKVTYCNWLKYQGDFSTARVRRFRAKNDKVKRSKRRGEEKRGEEKKKRVFIAPTLLEVENYCKERKNNVNVKKWFDHYTANGWRRGKNKMADWKAAVRTWEEDGFTAADEAGREKLKADLKQAYRQLTRQQGYLDSMDEDDPRRAGHKAEVERLKKKIGIIEGRLRDVAKIGGGE